MEDGSGEPSPAAEGLAYGPLPPMGVGLGVAIGILVGIVFGRASGDASKRPHTQ